MGQKRLKSAESTFVDSVSGFDCGPSADSICGSRKRPLQNGSKRFMDLSLVDSGCFATRCAIKYVHEVVSNFDSVKKELVRSTGFGGILHFPPMRQINRKVSMYLMKHVKQATCTLIIGDHIKITFNKYDIANMFGIPVDGKAVVCAGVGSRDAKQFVIESFLGSEFQEQRSVKICQHILEREYIHPMSKKEEDTFKVAFVVFVVSNLLCPSAKYDYASVDYWNAIQDPDDIMSYDWAGFVLARLIDGVSKLKQDIGNNIKFPNVTGCALFLQVLYLDSLDLVGLSLPHDTLPRIRVFPFETIRKMIGADKNFFRHCKQDNGLPVTKLRDPSGCIYTWALDVPESQVGSSSSCLLDIWQTAVAMVQMLDIPFEAAGPIFVAVANFQEQLNSGFIVNGNVAVKFLHVLVMIMFPYTRGFKYQPAGAAPPLQDGDEMVSTAIANGMSLLAEPIHLMPRSCNSVASVASQVSNNPGCARNGSLNEGVVLGGLSLDECPIGDDVERSIHRALASIKDLPDDMDVSERVASTMSQFYYIFRNRERRNQLSVNVSFNVASCSSSSSSGSAVLDDVPSPWDLGYVWDMEGCNRNDIRLKLEQMSFDERMAIVHRVPKYIQVSLCSLASQLLGHYEMDVDLFDALLRSARQADDSLYASYGALRWRHLFESDFMGSVLSGLYDCSDLSIRQHLCLQGFSFDMTSCKLVFFPALLHQHWVCFVWNPDKNMIIVFDPSFKASCPEWRRRLVERASYKLKVVLHTLIPSVFKGVVSNVWEAELRLVNIADNSIERMNRTGVLCSMFYRCFDGSRLVDVGAKCGADFIVPNLLMALRNMEGNHGCLSVLLDSSP